MRTALAAKFGKDDPAIAAILNARPQPVASAPLPGSEDYHTTHCDEHCEDSKMIFWKVALIGLAIGMAAGGILAAAGIAGHVLAGLYGWAKRLPWQLR